MLHTGALYTAPTGSHSQQIQRNTQEAPSVQINSRPVIAIGWDFLRGMIELSKSVATLHHHSCLNRDFCANLQWWAEFTTTVRKWNGQCFLIPELQASPDVTVYTDASGTLGCGGLWQEWFQLPWYPTWEGVNITAKELTPIIMAATLWGHLGPARPCSSTATIRLSFIVRIQAGSSKEPLVGQLLRCLFMLAAYNNFHPIGKELC